MRYVYEGQSFSRSEAGDLMPVQLVRLFRDMLRIRRVEEAVEARYHEDQMKTPIHLVIGQEAICVGACSALEHRDLVYAGHRTHGVYLAKGGDLPAMFSEFFCRKNGCAGSRGGSMHLIDQRVGMAGSSAICGGNVPIAAGMGLAAQLLGLERVSACFFGDGAAEEGVIWETLNFAALKRLPSIFVCENNFFSVFTPLFKRQPEGAELWKKAESFGVTAEVVDGTNVLAVHAAARRAVARARSGGGPSFIEARAYRWRGHGGAGDDNHKGYRDPAELTLWQQHCPVERYYEWLLEAGHIAASERESMEREIDAEIAAAYQHAEQSPNPTRADLDTHVYAETGA
ncbi:MAG: thiamine pyrophosphate-dependent dehydrogenase E1 component subunit alpha [Myxococcales bacterium]|nr:thiamine pyrophosphate-dependent dehydrogenase E1 component subunit alpha [Myxococcales bacterium]